MSELLWNWLEFCNELFCFSIRKVALLRSFDEPVFNVDSLKRKGNPVHELEGHIEPICRIVRISDDEFIRYVTELIGLL